MHPFRYIKRILIGLALAAVVLYAADFLSVRFQIPKSRKLFDTVQVQRYYAVRLKNGKTEFLYDDPQTEECVNSLFPQAGHTPCWYAKRKRQKRTDI